VARGLPDTPEALARYERAKLRTVRWLRGQLEREGLASRYRVSAREMRP